LKVSTSQLILSCEHGGNRIPAVYRHLFGPDPVILNTHRGLDIGALAIARVLARTLSVPLHYSQTSRLLVDLNRSLHHRKLFSEFSRACDAETRGHILQKFYHPYRQKLEHHIRKLITDRRPVLHLSIHSFTPELAGQIRNADFGLLYDPARRQEKQFCARLKSALDAYSSRVTRLNYPYRGNADGMTTYLRRQFTHSAYLGIEIEINQDHILTDSKQISDILIAALRELLIA
jgi:predicted N-formylglutamate amidohydrolase